MQGQIDPRLATPNPIILLYQWAEIRGLRFRAGEYSSIDEAIRPLAKYAANNPVTAKLGKKAVQEIISGGFFCRELRGGRA